MEQKFILLACGTGASSGLMASNMRKAAKERGLNFIIKAVSDSEIEDFADEITLLLIGPHISYLEDDLLELSKKKGFELSVIPKEIYGTLNGNLAIDLVIEKVGE